MALLATRYITVEDARLHVGLESLGTDQEKKLKAAIADASAEVETRTGTWWDKRKVQVTTAAVEMGQTKLFMPARIIDIESVTVGGVALDASLYRVFTKHLEMVDGSSWTRTPQAIVVVGNMGQAITPGDIKRAAKEIAGAYSGLKTKTYVANDGIQNTTTDTKIADWADEILDARAERQLVPQNFAVVQA